METILTLNKLNKKYGSVHAVNNLSFTISKGKVYGILGPNGSGKSTTLGMILNVVNPTSGSFEWFKGTITTHNALKKVGAIIERPNFYPSMSAYENLRLVCKIKDVPETKIDEKLKTVHLFERKNSSFKTFSLGMKQRLAIASALLNDPEILILDEPTNGLDPQGIHEIRQIIKDIASKGTTILLASHLLDEVEKVCTDVVIIQKGKKLYEGRVDEMKAAAGWIDMQCDEPSKLKTLLLNYNGITSVTEENNLIIATLSQDISTAALNKFAFENNIVLTHLSKRKPSLESKFLALTEQ